MPPENEAAATNPETGSQPQERPLSFRERMQQKLAAERGPRGEPQEVNPGTRQQLSEQAEAQSETPPAEPRQAETGGEEEHQEDLHEETQEPTPETDETEAAVTETSDEDAEPGEESDTPADENSIEYWQSRAEEAETNRARMERDYRIKTHKQAAAVRDAEHQGEELSAMAVFYDNLAGQNLQHFEQIDWAALRTEPEKYGQTRAAYETAVRQSEQLRNQARQVMQRVQEIREQAKNRHAEVSKDILATTVPGWGKELNEQLRKFATTELYYTEDEYDDLTDWRTISMLHELRDLREKVKGVTLKPKFNRKKAKKPSAMPQREQKTGVRRNAQGKFQNAKQALWENPGDRQARRSFFEEKLAAERAGRR